MELYQERPEVERREKKAGEGAEKEEEPKNKLTEKKKA